MEEKFLDALNFNRIDKHSEKQYELDKLTYAEKAELLETQIHSIYNLWNDCTSKANQIMNSFGTSASSDDLLKNKIFDFDNFVSQALWANKKISYPNNVPKTIYQWSIFYCDLGYNIGSEQNKRRPVIILNDTKIIQSSVVLVAPITSNGKKIYNQEVELIETAYSKIVGKVDLSHIRSISKSRLDMQSIDRLLNIGEYQKKYSNKKYTMIQDVISNKIKQIFGIAI